MTVEQGYRIERFDPEGEPVKFFSDEALIINFEDGYAVVKDSRLQDIADAPLCEHGNVYPHADGDSITADGNVSRWHLCHGSLELAALLASLKEER